MPVMNTRYYCPDIINGEKRRRILRDAPVALNGIDYLEVLDTEAPEGTPPQRTLFVRMLKSSPWGLSDTNVRVDGGVRVEGIRVDWTLRASDASDALVSHGMITAAEKNLFLGLPEPDHVLVVRTTADGDYAWYTLRLVASPTLDQPPPGFDPILSRVDFSFKVECPSEFDCESESHMPPERYETPVIDYLAKDYASFRKLMLDRLSVIPAEWKERNPADIGMAVVEVLAYAGDYLSYYQDAVGAEAYLGTARRRTSVRRHARLLDYPMHDGCNARTWVHFDVEADVTLEAGTQLLTRVKGEGVAIRPDSSDYTHALSQRPTVFETMHRASLVPAHNRMEFYAWGDDRCCLPIGATRATLSGRFPALKPGAVLLFIEERGIATGRAADADIDHRHAVRLTSVTPSEDPLGGRLLEPPTGDPVPVTEIEWHAEDALPFALCIGLVTVPEEERGPGEPENGVRKLKLSQQPVGAVLGNIVLADHGRTIEGEEIPPPVGHRRYRPLLQEREITFRTEYDPGYPGYPGYYDATQTRSARTTLDQNPRDALPAVTLSGDGTTWVARRDLLNSHRFATEFVVEMESDGRAFLRFGDGVFGKLPPRENRLRATYRIGNGAAGNIGAEAIAHVVTESGGIAGVRNPLPAKGGEAPETMEEVRRFAPQAFRTQERAVTVEDYAAVAQRHPEVQKAMATRRWTGSWYTIFLTVDRRHGLPVDAKFEDALRGFLERFRLAGQDLEIDSPRFVSLEIAFVVCVEPNYYRGDVKAALLEVLGGRAQPDGRRAKKYYGFFHPDNFTFGEPVYLSRIVAEAMQVPGVRWIDTANHPPNRFRRWGEPARDEFEKGRIEMGRLEIARLDNDPSRPENGKIDFIMEGGL